MTIRRIHDQVPADSGFERQAMASMENVGSDFMTYDDGTSRVQISGEFRELERRSPQGLQLFAIWEPQGDRWRVLGSGGENPWEGVVGDDQSLGDGLAPVSGPLPRTHSMACDGQVWEVSAAKKLRARAPVFDFNGWLGLLRSKRAPLHKLPRGRLQLVAESNWRAERKLVGYRMTSYTIVFPTNMRLMARVWAPALTTVRVLSVDPVTMASRALLEFSPFCGLGPSLTGLTADADDLREAQPAEPAIDPITHEYIIRPLLWHRDGDPEEIYYPNLMRIGPWSGVSWVDRQRPAHYDVSPPALVQEGEAAFVSVAAVYATAAGAIYPDGSGVASLTCMRTTSGDPALSAITWDDPEGWGPEFYAAAAQMYLHRAGPTRLFLLLRTLRQLRPGQPWEVVNVGGTYTVKLPSDLQYRSPANDLRLIWSDTNGAGWAQMPMAAVRAALGDFSATDVVAPDGEGGVWMTGVLQRTVSFSPTTTPIYGQCNTHRVLRASPTGLEQVFEVTDEGLYQHLYPGAMRTASPRSSMVEVVPFRRWAAFRLTMGWFSSGSAVTLNDPRTVLAVAEFNGASWSWSFRALPVVDARAVVRIFAMDEKTLAAVVVLGAPRFNSFTTGGGVNYPGAQSKMKGVLWVSKDRGLTWKRHPSGEFALPRYAQLDGTSHTALRQTLNGTISDLRANTSIHVTQELYGPVVMEDDSGREAAMCPGLPWVYDQTKEIPT